MTEEEMIRLKKDSAVIEHMICDVFKLILQTYSIREQLKRLIPQYEIDDEVWLDKILNIEEPKKE